MPGWLESPKNLYKRKYGLEGLFENADGPKWQVAEGRGVQTALQNKLEYLKAMYNNKYSSEADEGVSEDRRVPTDMRPNDNQQLQDKTRAH